MTSECIFIKSLDGILETTTYETNPETWDAYNSWDKGDCSEFGVLKIWSSYFFDTTPRNFYEEEHLKEDIDSLVNHLNKLRGKLDENT